MLTNDISGFDWDKGNCDKCQKHGVSIQEIESLFESSIAVFPDIAHSAREKRFIAIGKTAKVRYVFMVFTLRDSEHGKLIRPISARYMHDKEVKYYEKTLANTKNG
ncbi:MAG: BrnT family toxin [Chryseobacterium sp.]